MCLANSIMIRANILHMACATENYELLNHLFQKLPRNELEEMSMQRGGPAKDTVSAAVQFT